MNEDLKYLAHMNYMLMNIHAGKNYLALIINRSNKQFNMAFKCKPPPDVRQIMRLNNFCWCRKHKYWRSYLNKTQIKRAKKIYTELNKNK